MSTHGGGLSNCGEIMNKFSGKSIRLIIVALVAGLLTPVTAAVSVDTITKTFTVRDASNNLLPMPGCNCVTTMLPEELFDQQWV
jgi:hypothetical protein